MRRDRRNGGLLFGIECDTECGGALGAVALACTGAVGAGRRHAGGASESRALLDVA